MRYIEHIIEPQRLLLSWQPKDNKNRQRMLVAELCRNKYNDADLIYRTQSPDFINAQKIGFPGYPGLGTGIAIHNNVLTPFIKRLPPRTREDFNRFLEALRIRPDATISDFALLGYSGAKLPDDDFTIIHPFDDTLPPFEFILQIQGYQHYKEQMPFKASINMKATFEPEPDNIYDSDAVKIIVNGVMAGYVCRGLTTSFHKWLQSNLTISAYIERINGTEQKPKAYLYVSIK